MIVDVTVERTVDAIVDEIHARGDLIVLSNLALRMDARQQSVGRRHVVTTRLGDYLHVVVVVDAFGEMLVQCRIDDLRELQHRE